MQLNKKDSERFLRNMMKKENEPLSEIDKEITQGVKDFQEKIKGIVLQEEISIDRQFVEEAIKYYENMSEDLCMGLGSWTGKKADILREIKALTPIGKQILLMHYRWVNSDLYKELVEKKASSSKMKSARN